MINLESDLRVSFEQIDIKFQSMMRNYQNELERLLKKSIDNFDFETAIKQHVDAKINQGLDEAFDEVDLSLIFKDHIRKLIEERISMGVTK